MKRVYAFIATLLCLIIMFSACSDIQSNADSTNTNPTSRTVIDKPDPTQASTESPAETQNPPHKPTLRPTTQPTEAPTEAPVPEPTIEPTPEPTIKMTEPQTVTVYITKTGEKYHSDGCQYLKKSKIPIDLDDAISQGYEPCSKCHPPQ